MARASTATAQGPRWGRWGRRGKERIELDPESGLANLQLFLSQRHGFHAGGTALPMLGSLESPSLRGNQHSACRTDR